MTGGGPLRWVNLTTHEVKVLDETGRTILTVPSDGRFARVEEHGLEVDPLGDIPMLQLSYGTIVDLPEPEADTILVVSRVLAERAPERTDLVFPVREVRGPDGRIVGCRGFARFAGPRNTQEVVR